MPVTIGSSSADVGLRHLFLAAMAEPSGKILEN